MVADAVADKITDFVIKSNRRRDIRNHGYSHHGASRSKKSLKGWDASGGSTKEDIDDNLDTLRKRSRDLAMGTPLAIGALRTIRTNVVGPGLKPAPNIDYKYLGLSEEEADDLEEQISREWSLWAESIHCDVQRMNDFYELQQLAFMASLMSGESFAILPTIPRPNMPYDLRVMVLEADRCCSPSGERKTGGNKIINGVEVSSLGETLAYWICDRHPGSSNIYEMGGRKWTRIKKFGSKTGRPNILHIMESERPEQRRGVPLLSPVIVALKQLSRYTEAELMAAVVSGLFTVFIEQKEEETDAPYVGQYEEQEDGVVESDEGERNLRLGAGAIVELGEGETVKDANPGRPNTAFDGFVQAICRQIGSALEIPYELLIKHFTASYSASRAALLEAWKMFRMRRSWLASDFCQPIYEEWFSEAVAKGRIKAPGFYSDPAVRKVYCRADWHGPTQGQLNPKLEVEAAATRVKEGFSTRQRETVELTGGDFNRNHRQRIKEEKMMKEGSLQEDE